MNTHIKIPSVLLAVLCICLLVSTATYIPATEAIIPIIIGLVAAGAFIAGVITTWMIAQSSSVTVYETGAEKGGYLLDIANLWEASLQQATTMFQNDYSQCQVGLKYYWYRQAEYTAQQFINETTFPREKVWIESSIQDAWYNFTGAKLNMAYQQLKLIDDYAVTGDLNNFETLDIKTYAYDPYWSTSDASLKQSTPLELLNAMGDTNGNEIVFYINKFTEQEQQYITTCGAGTVVIYDDTAEAEVYQAVVSNEQHININDVLEESEIDYTHQYHVRAISGTLAISFGAGIMQTPFDLDSSSDFHYNVSQERQGCTIAQHYIAFFNGSENIKEIDFADVGAGLQDSLDNLIYLVSGMQDSALNAAQARWQYLRNLGYTDVSQIPPDLLVPSVTNINLSTNSTNNLTPEQWLVLYQAYLNNMAKFFNSTNYREYNLTSTNFDMASLDYAFESKVWALDGTYYNYFAWEGNPTGVEYCYFIPYTHSLTLTIGQNTTLDQQVDCLVFNKSNQTLKGVYSFASGDKIDIQHIYTNGTLSSLTTATVSINTLKQVSEKYGFTIVGEPKHGIVIEGFNSTIWLLIVLAVAAVVLMQFVPKRR